MPNDLPPWSAVYQQMRRWLGAAASSVINRPNVTPPTKTISSKNRIPGLHNRGDDAFIDDLAKQGIAYVPYFPLGGFTPLQSSIMDTVAASLGVTPMQVAQAWLLHRSANILLIAGTSSRTHLRENLSVAKLQLAPEAIAQLDSAGIAAAK